MTATVSQRSNTIQYGTFTLNAAGAINGVLTVTTTSGVGVNISTTNAGILGTVALTDTGSNGVNIAMFGNGGTTPNKFLRVQNGVFEITNSAYSTVLLTLTDVGALGIAGAISCAGISATTITASALVYAQNGLLTVGGAFTPSTQGSYLGWNRTGGSGEMDFINNHGSGVGGWNWYDTSGAGTSLSLPMTLTAGGNLTCAGTIASNNGTLVANGGSSAAAQVELINGGGGGGAINKYIRCYGSLLQGVNSAYSAVIWSINDKGYMALGGGNSPVGPLDVQTAAGRIVVSSYGINLLVSYASNGSTSSEMGFGGTDFNFGGPIHPGSDNAYSCGESSLRWTVVYATTGTINTSDANEKTLLTEFSDAEMAAAKEMADRIGTYKWLDAVAEKGSSARTHIGLTAQLVQKIMVKHNLDPNAYGLFCFDKWEARDESADEHGNVIISKRAAGERFGLRYDEVTMFITRGISARLSAIEAMLTSGVPAHAN